MDALSPISWVQLLAPSPLPVSVKQQHQLIESQAHSDPSTESFMFICSFNNLAFGGCCYYL